MLVSVDVVVVDVVVVVVEVDVVSGVVDGGGGGAGPTARLLQERPSLCVEGVKQSMVLSVDRLWTATPNDETP